MKRNRSNRKAPRNWGAHDTEWFRCACGKRGLRDRAAARRYARHLRQRDHDMNVYSCDESVGELLYHVGHNGTRKERPNLNDPKELAS